MKDFSTLTLFSNRPIHLNFGRKTLGDAFLKENCILGRWVTFSYLDMLCI